MDDWTHVEKAIPEDGRIVMTKLDDTRGCRNEQPLKLIKRLWYVPDEAIYVYYVPTHWRPLSASEKDSLFESLAKRHLESVKQSDRILTELNNS